MCDNDNPDKVKKKNHIKSSFESGYKNIQQGKQEKEISNSVVMESYPTCACPHDALHKQHTTTFRPTIIHEKSDLMFAFLSWLTHNPNRPFRIRINYICAF